MEGSKLEAYVLSEVTLGVLDVSTVGSKLGVLVSTILGNTDGLSLGNMLICLPAISSIDTILG